jgi:hypothetical protein
MINFLFGVFAGMFLSLLLLQLFTKKTINLAGFTDKEKNPKRYWTFVFTYLGGFIAMVNLYFYI